MGEVVSRTVPFRHPLTGAVSRVGVPADSIPRLDADGMLVCFAPDFSQPGVAERVSREAFFDALAAERGPRNLLHDAIRIKRFEEQMAAKYGDGQ